MATTRSLQIRSDPPEFQMNTFSKSISALFACLLAVNAAHAAFITVDTAADELNSDGDCSLREAIASANQNTAFDTCTAGGAVGTDSIFVAVNATISLNFALVVEERVTIFGLGPDATVLDAGSGDRHMVVDMPDDTHDFDLSGMAFVNGLGTSSSGALWITRVGDARLENLRFEDNEGLEGGAVGFTIPRDDVGSLEIINCDFERNASGRNGGAIFVDGPPDHEPPASLTLERSLFIDNQAARNGGAVAIYDATSISIEWSEFRSNETLGTGESRARGGALFWRATKPRS